MMSYKCAVLKRTLLIMGRDFMKCEGLHITLAIIYAAVWLFSAIFSLVILAAWVFADIYPTDLAWKVLGYTAGNVGFWIFLWCMDAWFRAKDEMK